jgi:hypothetical protein
MTPDPDDVDARFRDLISAEYGIGDPRNWTPPPEEDEPYVPPPPEPFYPISTPAMAALILFVIAAVLGVFVLAGVTLPWWGGGIAVACFVAGLALALSRLPRDRPPRDDDGAVV